MLLAAAAACYAAALVCCAGSWRSLLPARLGLRDSLARYGAGSLANTVLPARLGDGVRVGLFARVVPGGALAVVGAVAAVGAVRWLALTPLGVAATANAHVPRAALAAGAVPLVVAAVLARRGHLTARPNAYAAAAVWIVGVVATRVLAAAAVAASFGITHPLAAALVVVPALEVAGVVALAPANLGLAGGAAALAFHLNGTPAATAVAAGFALHAVETGTALAAGIASAVVLGLARSGPARPRVEDQPPVPRASEVEQPGEIERHAFRRVNRRLDLVG
jgi:hypothetical protein